MKALRFSTFILIAVFLFDGNMAATASTNADDKNAEKIAKIEEDIRLLTNELVLSFTYEQASELGASNYQDNKARNMSERQLNDMDKKREKLVKKIMKKKEKLAKQKEN